MLWLQNDIRAEGVVVRPLELPGPDGRPAGPGAVPGDLLPPAPLRPPTPSPRGPQSLPPLLKLHHSGGGHLHPHVQSRSLISHQDLQTSGPFQEFAFHSFTWPWPYRISRLWVSDSRS